ncbi:MAG: nitroreductase [Spirochaetae bacterium HGW-Spirochaetae-5]|nr:MAG: nitroreductase [Spirochaetae bacterium HGW-Spirochaetae-5]
MAEKKIEETIMKRYSCRSYTDTPLSERDRSDISELISQKFTGPFGSSTRFTLFAAEPTDSTALKGLGTYGFIKNPAAFIAGIVNESEMVPEDFGYSMESIILHVTEMGLGSCWLGGSFKRSSFGKKAGILDTETIPAVASIGYKADKRTLTDGIIRTSAGSAKRKNSNEIFFTDTMNELNIDFNVGYGKVLEMVRLAPSASNKQPWRIVKEEGKNIFHFYLERTTSYTMMIKLLKYADLQRIDMGIAMYHFETAAAESGLKGKWIIDQPLDIKTPKGWDFTITWDGEC